MITPRQNYKFLITINKYLNYWSQRPTAFMFSGSLVAILVVLTFSGGILFWMSGFGYAFMSPQTNQTQLQTADSGLQTIKRMTGDSQIWSETIQKEYNRLFLPQPLGISTNYNDNFISQDPSTSQPAVK
ncbi:MAG: hypothetical protein KBC81_01875 [Candidatus Pacebacteria bacterium]|nr:hypothetical protein [Candidatus Paceibacterota bacterium]